MLASPTKTWIVFEIVAPWRYVFLIFVVLAVFGSPFGGNAGGQRVLSSDIEVVVEAGFVAFLGDHQQLVARAIPQEDRARFGWNNFSEPRNVLLTQVRERHATRQRDENLVIVKLMRENGNGL